MGMSAPEAANASIPRGGGMNANRGVPGGASRLVVLDTNVLVSGLLTTHSSPPVELAGLVLDGLLRLCYDEHMLAEYRFVLARPQLHLDRQKVNSLLRMITAYGFDVDPPRAALDFSDESDRPFYEVAELCLCPLVTGNQKHFPHKDWILSPAEYLAGF